MCSKKEIFAIFEEKIRHTNEMKSFTNCIETMKCHIKRIRSILTIDIINFNYKLPFTYNLQHFKVIKFRFHHLNSRKKSGATKLAILLIQMKGKCVNVNRLLNIKILHYFRTIEELLFIWGIFLIANEVVMRILGNYFMVDSVYDFWLDIIQDNENTTKANQYINDYTLPSDRMKPCDFDMKNLS